MKFVAITENHLYAKAYAKGKRAVSGTVVVYVLRDYAARRLRDAHPQKCFVNRIGLTVSKKLGGAVERNRAKRVLREAMRAVMASPGVKTGYLVVLAARERATLAKSTEVERDLRAALDKLGMLLDGRDGVS
ncbi:MAG: ribonuclease P protein component [Clostridia bacterium]|nr:ribonuclease P protein component [Clostridia bacterium]